MKPEETIRKLQIGIRNKHQRIELDRTFFPKQDNKRLEQDIEIYEVAIEALKKQIPQKMKNTHWVQIKETGACMRIGDCPVCGKPIPAEQIYCWSCGQRLDWSQD